MNTMQHYLTEETLARTDCWTTDYPKIEMLADNTLIECQLISHDGDLIKKDGTPGEELVMARVCDQRIFRSSILYWVKGISSDDTKFCKKGESTRSDLITFPVHRVDDKSPG